MWEGLRGLATTSSLGMEESSTDFMYLSTFHPPVLDLFPQWSLYMLDLIEKITNFLHHPITKATFYPEPLRRSPTVRSRIRRPKSQRSSNPLLKGKSQYVFKYEYETANDGHLRLVLASLAAKNAGLYRHQPREAPWVRLTRIASRLT